MRVRGWAASVGLLGVLAGVVLVPGAGAGADEYGMTAKEARESQWYLEDLGVLRAHEVTRGEGVTVCVIDGGVDPGLPDLQGVAFGPGVTLFGPGEAGVSRDYHGNGMAALIAGQGVGSGGIVGAAPGVRLISVSTGPNPDPEIIGDAQARAFAYCADRGASVINASFAGTESDREAVAYAQARDIVVVAGTGNGTSRDSIGYPAGDWGVLAVSGVGKSLVVDEFVDTAPASILARKMNDPLFADEISDSDQGGTGVMGPSSLGGWSRDDECDGYVSFSQLLEYVPGCGTSKSTAVVSGVVALVRSEFPELNAANVINRVLATAKPPTDGSGTPSPLYGWGVVDAHAAVTAQVPSVEHNPLGSVYTGSRGVWDERVTPSRAEPPAGATLPAVDPALPIATPSQWTLKDGSVVPDRTAELGLGQAEPGEDAGVPVWWWAAGGGVLVVLALVVIVVLVRHRGKGVRGDA